MRTANLTGKKIGKLTILEMIGAKNRSSIWKCQCECGKMVEKPRCYIQNKRFKQSCGCAKFDRIDRTGMIFGSMTIIKTLSNNFYICKCNTCNLESKIHRSSLHRLPKTCKCINRQQHKEKKILNKKFGKLLVVSHYKNDFWKCKCDCGNNCIAKGANLTCNRLFSCGCAKKDNYIDIANKTYGKIHVLRKLGSHNNGGALWQCRWTDCLHEFQETCTRIINKKRKICIICKKRPWSKEEEKFVQTAVKEGHTAKYIASNLFKRTERSVSTFVRRIGLKFIKVNINKSETVNLKKQGFNTKEISEMLSIGKSTVRKYLRENIITVKKELEKTREIIKFY